MKKAIWMLTLTIHSCFVFGQGDELRNFIENQLKTYPNCEIAIGVIDGEEEIKLGYRIVDGKLNAVDNSSTLYEIGSISKTFTAALFSRELQQGNMSLDDPIQRHLDFEIKKESFKNQTIKISHLVTHTSGMKKNPLVGYKKYAKYLKGFELDYIPGVNWEYNNMTIALLAKMITERNGRTWSDLLHQEILIPLDMQSTFVNRDDAPIESRVRCEGKNGEVKDCYYHKFQEFQWPAGAMISNVNDMITWMSANIEQNSPLDFLHLAHDPLGDSISIEWFDYYQATQGIVWRSYRTSKQKRIICHGGITPSHTSFIAMDKDQRKGVIVLINVNGASIWNEHKITKTTELAMKIFEL
ncbi:MAG: serine hydrolase domain-containing protein [Bacteroidota bacterium]